MEDMKMAKGKLKVKDIVVNEYLTVAQVKEIKSVINEWITCDNDYTFDNLLNDQTIMFAENCDDCICKPEVIKIEKLEWICNYQGRKNDYDSDITIWVTAIVDLGCDKIVRLSYDLLDSMLMDANSGCSGLIYQPQNK